MKKSLSKQELEHLESVPSEKTTPSRSGSIEAMNIGSRSLPRMTDLRVRPPEPHSRLALLGEIQEEPALETTFELRGAPIVPPCATKFASLVKEVNTLTLPRQLSVSALPRESRLSEQKPLRPPRPSRPEPVLERRAPKTAHMPSKPEPKSMREVQKFLESKPASNIDRHVPPKAPPPRPPKPELKKPKLAQKRAQQLLKATEQQIKQLQLAVERFQKEADLDLTIELAGVKAAGDSVMEKLRLYFPS